MKKKRIGFVIVISIVFLLSSCDITTLLDSLKGNAYEDVFDMNLVGEQAQEAVDTVVEASDPETVSEGDAVEDDGFGNDVVVVGEGAVDVIETPQGVDSPDDIPAGDVDDDDNDGIRDDLEDGEVAVIDGQVPTLPVQDEEEKEELKSTVTQALAGEGEDEFVEELEEPADDGQIVAAHNTQVVLEAVLEDVSGDLDTSGLDENDEDDQRLIQVFETFGELSDSLIVELPQEPTQADILNVQLASNLANSMVTALNVIAGDGNGLDTIDEVDTSDPEVQDAINQVISDAEFMLTVAQAQGPTSDLLNSIDVSNLFNLFNDNDRNIARIAVQQEEDPPENQSVEIPSDMILYLDSFNDTINIVLEDILGVNFGVNPPTMDYDSLLDATESYVAELNAFNGFLVASRAGNLNNSQVSDQANFIGVSGVLNYTIATVLVNLPEVLDEVQGTLDTINNPSVATIEAAVNLILAANSGLINPSGGYVEGMEAELPYVLEHLGFENYYTVDEAENLYFELELNTVAEKWLADAIYLAQLGIPEGSSDNIIIEMLNRIELPEVQEQP